MSFFSGLGHIFAVVATEIHNVELSIVRNQQKVDDNFQVAEGIERQIPGMYGTIPYLVTIAAHGAFGVLCAEIKKHNLAGTPLVNNPDGTVTLASGLTMGLTVYQQIADLIPIFEKAVASIGNTADTTPAPPANSLIPAYQPHK